MKFWIRVNGEQVGPMDIEQLKGQNITPTTYVWCAGMKDWSYARDVADLQDVIIYKNAVVTPPTQPVSEIVKEEVVEEQTSTEDVAEEIVEPATEVSNTTTNENEAEIESVEPEIVETVETPAEEIKEEPVNIVNEPQPCATASNKTEELPCPPTNILWSILITMLCCQPLGIAAIVCSAMVKSKYYDYGYETAKKYSDWSARLCIAGIVLTILYISFILPMSIMTVMM